jgi:putative transposase
MLGFLGQENPLKGKRFKEEQIICILQAAEAGIAVADLCRKHNCSEQSFYRWKANYAGMEVSDAKRLKELQRENAELKKMVAEQTLDIRMLKDVNSRKW